MKENKKAVSIAEILVVMLIIVTWVVWVYNIFSQSQKLSTTTKNRIEAIQIARGWIEAMTNIRNSNWILYASDHKNCWNTMNYNGDCISNTTGSTNTDIISWSYTIYTDSYNRWILSKKNTDSFRNPIYRDNFKVTKNTNNLYTQTWWNQFKPIFTREIKISYIEDTNDDTQINSNDEKMKVISLVQWSDSSWDKPHKVELETILTNWKFKKYQPITELNESPTNITLSNNTINENNSVNALVWILTDNDPDWTGSWASATNTYSLVSWFWDNSSFTISWNQLKISVRANFENKSNYSIRINSNDGTNDFAKTFSITIWNLNEAPTALSLSSTQVAENAWTNATVWTFSTTDQDTNNTYTYTLVPWAWATDNASFNINWSNLRLTSSADYETKDSYSIRANVNDGANDFARAFTISITDMNEVPTCPIWFSPRRTKFWWYICHNPTAQLGGSCHWFIYTVSIYYPNNNIYSCVSNSYFNLLF